MIKTDVLIVGAGIGGLYLGSLLKKLTIIIDKSKGVGGRIANRRTDHGAFDHGAPYLASDPKIIQIMRDFGFRHEINSSSYGLSIHSSMTRLPKMMAESQYVIKNCRLEKLDVQNEKWRASCSNGQEYEADFVVLTAPLPQSLELLSSNGIKYPAELSQVRYSKGIMALIATESGNLPDKELPHQLHSVLPMKERSLHLRGFVVRGSSQFSEEAFEETDEILLKKMTDLFQKGFSESQCINHAELKKWRYVLPETTLQTSYIEAQKNLFLITDAFFFGDVRGSIYGAEALAQKLL